MTEHHQSSHDLRRAVLRRIVQVVLSTVLWAVVFFVAAGRVDVPRAWIYLALTAVLLVFNFTYLASKNLAVIAARARGAAGTKTFDKVFGVFFVISIISLPLLAGLDGVRFEWAPLPMITLWPGLLLIIAGHIPIIWSMAENPHLEKMVRIQDDRGHRVIMTGPYKFVRHPMYVGLILQQLGLPLVLGSSWAFAAAAASFMLLVVRTALEDRTLRLELSGYEEFASRTRYRLIPGVW